MPNRLINETSPYLLQHAHNPVNWYPWGENAFKTAAKEDKPVLVSIGYSACHWCHVMEKECFENADIAKLMNEKFINIKVDREERPDIDTIYMAAVQAMTGSGGWPLNVFLTPQKRPYYGGTYFPPEDISGRPGFPTVLEVAASAYKNRKEKVESAAEEIISYLNRYFNGKGASLPVRLETLDNAYASIKSTFDVKNGGFGSAPKFPQPMSLEFLLRHYKRTGDKEALFIVERTLDKMAKGGMYDQIGGGFHRYSVDQRWLVPHFEKMLYDNALLSRVYLHAYQATGKKQYRKIVEETLDYVLRYMVDVRGGFYSTQDADSEGVEGKFYTWKIDEILEVLDDKSAHIIIDHLGMSKTGNFEGTNILNQVIDTDVLAHKLNIAMDEMDRLLVKARQTLLKKRAQRVPPHRDEKILTDWNGLMLASLAEAALVLDRNDYLEAAMADAAFITDHMFNGEKLKHVYKDGKARIDAYLLDYAALCEGLLYLFQATFNEKWLKSAAILADSMIKLFWDDLKYCFFDTPREDAELVIRPRNVYDNALPSGSAAATLVLIHLARLTGRTYYEKIAGENIAAMQDYINQYPSGFSHWLCAQDFYLSKMQEIAMVGPMDDTTARLLLDVITLRYLPNKIFAGKDIDGKAAEGMIPFLQDKGMIDGKPAAYVCEDHICQQPLTDPEALAQLLDRC